jgi:hypothetical protein
MAAVEHYQKQFELLLLWIQITTDPSVKLRLVQRAVELASLANRSDHITLLALETAATDLMEQLQLQSPLK